jgi:translation initiation factor 5A
MSWLQQEIRELKVNRYILIDEEPCRILSIQTGKTGKHGEAKSRIDAIGLFDEKKRSIVHPVTHKVKVPQIDKRKAQVLALMGEDKAQLMDLETYETFELEIPADFKGQIQPGAEILYMSAMGRRKMTRL